MQTKNKTELECILRLDGINRDIPEFGKMGLLDSVDKDHYCINCADFKPFGMGNDNSNNYCTNPLIISLYQDMQNQPCTHVHIGDFMAKEKEEKVTSLLNNMALDSIKGEEYNKTKQEFIETVSELCRQKTDFKAIRYLIHTYNNILFVKEIVTTV